LNYFSELVSCFDKLQEQGIVFHGMQTNATLINEQWCQFFHDKQFRVGVSIDGPFWANKKRKDWTGKYIFHKTMHGIKQLKSAGVPFSIICVVGRNNLDKADELYDFFVSSGCVSLGINIEEQLGSHVVNMKNDSDNVFNFWQQLFKAWKNNPVIKIREFANMLPSLMMLGDNLCDDQSKLYDIFPSVAWNGDVVLLSPEFLGAKSSIYNDFVVGNMQRGNLSDIINQWKKIPYIQDFTQGVHSCKRECEYFPVCYGGQAGNKFFEHGRIDVTNTVFCQNSEKSLADAILQQLQGKSMKGGNR
jgi:uncharacterized protein